MKGLRSTASRLALWSLLGSMAVMVTCGLALLSHLRSQWLISAQREGSTLAMAAAGGIQARIERVSESTRLLARLAALRPDRAPVFAHESLEANEDIASVSFSWQPADQAAPPPAPFVDRLADGSISQRDLGKDSTRYWEQPWFKTGINCEQGCWQQPFFSLSRQQRLVNYSVAIRGGERGIGLVNADVRLTWLKQVLATLHRPDGAVMFVVDAQGRYLAHDDPQLLGKLSPASLQALIRAPAGGAQAIAPRQVPDVVAVSWVFSAPIGNTPWTLGLLVPQAQLEGTLRHLFLRALALGLMAMLGIAAIILIMTRRTLSPLTILTQRAEHVARGELDFVLPVVKRRDEIGRLTQAFDAMRQQLSVHLARLTEATRAQERLRSELEIAHQIQVALLPSAHYLDAHCAMFELHAVLRPARAVGGDLYTYFMLDELHFCVMVGDVSDKGIPAALFMARAITLAKALAPRARRPHQLLAQLNRELCRNNDGCMFVTLLCGVLETSSGRMVMASAGHEAPILCRDGRHTLFEVETGPAIGLDEDATYPEQVLLLAAGDTLLLYTDGITEAGDATGDMFGIQRTLASLARDPAPQTAMAVTERLLSDVDAFAGACDQTDDITILALSWNHAGNREPECLLDLTVAPDLPEVFDLLEQGDLVLTEAGIAVGTREDVRLVLEELMVNIVQHGRQDRSERRIRLQLSLSAHQVQVDLHDNGTRFDPLEVHAPSLTGDIADSEEVGGLGVHLVRALAGPMHYHRDSEGNHLQLSFLAAPPPPPTEPAP